jgi:hypothetical protein
MKYHLITIGIMLLALTIIGLFIMFLSWIDSMFTKTEQFTFLAGACGLAIVFVGIRLLYLTIYQEVIINFKKNKKSINNEQR